MGVDRKYPEGKFKSDGRSESLSTIDGTISIGRRRCGGTGWKIAGTCSEYGSPFKVTKAGSRRCFEWKNDHGTCARPFGFGSLGRTATPAGENFGKFPLCARH